MRLNPNGWAGFAVSCVGFAILVIIMSAIIVALPFGCGVPVGAVCR